MDNSVGANEWDSMGNSARELNDTTGVLQDVSNTRINSQDSDSTQAQKSTLSPRKRLHSAGNRQSIPAYNSSNASRRSSMIRFDSRFSDAPDGDRDTARRSYNSSRIKNRIKNKREELNRLNTQVMTLKTQRANQEFENFKLEDRAIVLKEKLGTLNEEIEELKHHESESFKELEYKYQLTTKSLGLSHEEKIHKLKEEISSDIETLIEESVRRNGKKKESLLEERDNLLKQIKVQEQELNRKLIKLKEDYNKKLIMLDKGMDDNISSLKQELNTLQEAREDTDRRCVYLQSDEIPNLKTLNEKLNKKLNHLKIKFHSKDMEISNLKNQILSLSTTRTNIEKTFESKDASIKYFNEKSLALNDKLTDYEHERRVLHNRLQELKGNIRVYCRIRPINGEVIKKDSESTDMIPMEFSSDDFNEEANQELTISKEPISEYPSSYSLHNKVSNSHKFQFDKIFSPETSNQEIFEELSQLVQSSLDGYNVCVFAYGQTGSGKTWTMSHPEDGMIPSSINKIFNDINTLKSKGWDYNVEGQCLEIYNETIIDLLSPSTNLNKKLEIKHDDVNQVTSVTNLTSSKLETKEQARQLLHRAMQNRSTASTKSNERSSRSHSIFMLKFEGTNKMSNEKSSGTLNLIDLAGSERLSSSQVRGERLKETQAINKSLSCLGDVIYSLGQQQNGINQHHIPYRNSKLTYLLKHSLGGNAKTLMFVNISPLLKNFNETLNSLRFATKVNSTKLGSK
ncbi:Piso0_005843 [Millerozyma farinosa CBS 7064]|uniref:Kinesin-like protein n=1 Tax=Pichia sorbitophila (strain ATCC MYA-4447 / BCRC 22081 / CBS 7064 / NBRC 10061 / NRRL Y-12695) TaxID=559304 RepID=G8Y036_PICSO|nr:Piso0_005843 [Millerozyma farinosa CBS 7064]